MGLNPSLSSKKTLPMAVIPQSASIPDEFDWRDYNVVTPVKNQVFKNCVYIILNYNKYSIKVYIVNNNLLLLTIKLVGKLIQI